MNTPFSERCVPIMVHIITLAEGGAGETVTREWQEAVSHVAAQSGVFEYAISATILLSVIKRSFPDDWELLARAATNAAVEQLSA